MRWFSRKANLSLYLACDLDKLVIGWPPTPRGGMFVHQKLSDVDQMPSRVDQGCPGKRWQ